MVHEVGLVSEVADGVKPMSRRSQPCTLDYEIKELISCFPLVVAFEKYLLASCIKLV